MKRNLHVTSHEDGWVIKQEGDDQPRSTHSSRKAAIEAAEAIAVEEQVNVVIHREDGTFKSVKNFSSDQLENRDGAILSNLDPKDVVSVGSRISWSALLGGAVITLTLYLALGLLGVAIGLSVGQEVGGEEFAFATVIWGALALCVSLFVGGFVTSRSTVGENKAEALTHGILLWAVLFISLVHLTSLGLDNGFGRLALSTNESRARSGNPAVLADETLASAGFNGEQIAKYREMMTEVGQETVGLSSTAAAWWAFVILLVSMIASILGALVGAGPELVLRRIQGNRAALVRAR